MTRSLVDCKAGSSFEVTQLVPHLRLLFSLALKLGPYKTHLNQHRPWLGGHGSTCHSWNDRIDWRFHHLPSCLVGDGSCSAAQGYDGYEVQTGMGCVPMGRGSAEVAIAEVESGVSSYTQKHQKPGRSSRLFCLVGTSSLDQFGGI